MCKKGCSLEKIALDYGVEVRTVYDIRKAGDQKLLKYRSENPNSGIKSIFKDSYYPELDKSLKIWVYQARTINIHLSHDIVATQAKVLYDQFYPVREDDPNKSELKGSRGFVQRFCGRHNFFSKKLCGEKLINNKDKKKKI